MSQGVSVGEYSINVGMVEADTQVHSGELATTEPHGGRKMHAWKGDQARMIQTNAPRTTLPAIVARVRRGASKLHLDVVFNVCRDNVKAPVLVVVLNVRPPPLLDRDCDRSVLWRPGDGGTEGLALLLHARAIVVAVAGMCRHA